MISRDAPNPGVLDLDRALARVSDDRELLADLAKIFIDELPHWIREIEDAILNDDPRALVRGAHTNKGSADAFDASRVVEAARALEVMGRSDDLSGAEEAFGALEAELVWLRQALRNI